MRQPLRRRQRPPASQLRRRQRLRQQQRRACSHFADGFRRPVGDRAIAGEPLIQWASSAAASSEYGPDSWSANQATGEPDTPEYGDFATAWAPSGTDIGPQWIELGYDVAVRPTEIVIWESSGAGFVTRVEAVDARTGETVTLWEGTDGSPDFLVGFSPPLEPIDVRDRLAAHLDRHRRAGLERDRRGRADRRPGGSD